MRLECHQQAPTLKRFERRQGRPDFRRMMAIVVEDPEARVREDFLLAARGPLKWPDGFRDFFRRETKQVQKRDDGGRVR